MAKQKFERTKPHMNRHCTRDTRSVRRLLSKTSTKHPKKENVASQFPQRTLSMKHLQDTMRTLTARAMLTM